MKTKLATALSGCAALLLALSGCGDDTSDQVDDYAKKLCDQLQPQLQKITSANKSITATAADGNPTNIRKTDSSAFQQISTAYAAMGDAVEKAGAPPVDDGETKQRNAVKGLDATSQAYAGLKKSVDNLNTKNQSKFAAGLNGVADQLGKVNKTGDDAIASLQSGDVGKAMSKQPGCQRPSASASAS